MRNSTLQPATIILRGLDVIECFIMVLDGRAVCPRCGSTLNTAELGLDHAQIVTLIQQNIVAYGDGGHLTTYLLKLLTVPDEAILAEGFQSREEVRQTNIRFEDLLAWQPATTTQPTSPASTLADALA